MRSVLLASVALVTACSSSAPGAGGAGGTGIDASTPIGWVDAGGAVWGGDGGMGGDQPPVDAAKAVDDAGGYPLCDGGTLAADRFVTGVVSFTPGDCAGFGAAQMPAIVVGPPVGSGDSQGGTDVVSLGAGGSIVVSFAPNAIVDGPGPDFVVFENAFYVAGNRARVFAEPGEVSVSDDGATWTPFPCTATAAPYGACAGWHPVYASPDTCISPLDTAAAGGDAFDLHDVGVARARYVRVVDRTAGETCPADPSQRLTTNGFDLDAVAIVNAERD